MSPESFSDSPAISKSLPADSQAAATSVPTTAGRTLLNYAVLLAALLYLDRVCISQSQSLISAELGLTKADMASDTLRLRVGTRASRLALWQTDHVIDRLRQQRPGLEVERVPITTLGDRVTTVALSKIGDKGIFTRELEEGLRTGAIDLAVHSLKDLPTEPPADLAIGAILERDDPRDVLVAGSGATLASLPAGARIGTSSLRRRAQLAATRPDLEIVDIRGNVPTRLEKVWRGDVDAVLLAFAGLRRLGLESHVSEILDPVEMLPAPGQGALAVQMRNDDDRLATLLASLEHAAGRTLPARVSRPPREARLPDVLSHSRDRVRDHVAAGAAA